MSTDAQATAEYALPIPEPDGRSQPQARELLGPLRVTSNRNRRLQP